MPSLSKSCLHCVIETEIAIKGIFHEKCIIVLSNPFCWAVRVKKGKGFTSKLIEMLIEYGFMRFIKDKPLFL